MHVHYAKKIATSNSFSAGRVFIILCCCSIIALSSFLSGCANQKAVFGTSINIDGLNKESSTGKAGQALGDSIKQKEPVDKTLTHKILATAYSQMGKLYKFGGTSPETGFDCSGFTQWSFAQHGVKLSRTTKSLINEGKQVKKEDIRPGDLLLFKRYRRGSSMHVGIYTGNGKFIHSPHTGDRVKESDAFGKHYTARFIQARRVLEDPAIEPLPDKRKEEIVAKALKANNKPVPKKKSTAVAKAKKSKNTKHYKIKKGDTIWMVARRFGVSPKNLLQANNLSTRHTLKIGQKIAIP